MAILVVEDSQDIREVLVDILTGEGYTVFAAKDGQEAMELLPSLHPAPLLILLDLMMPRMSGWEFRAWQRAQPNLAAIPVIALSAVADLPQHLTVLDAAGAVSKPFSLDQLLEVVEDVYQPCDW